jgi:hypothetical protein
VIIGRWKANNPPQLAEFAEHRQIGLLGLFGEKVLQPQGFVVEEFSCWFMDSKKSESSSMKRVSDSWSTVVIV